MFVSNDSKLSNLQKTAKAAVLRDKKKKLRFYHLSAQFHLVKGTAMPNPSFVNISSFIIIKTNIKSINFTFLLQLESIVLVHFDF